MNNNECTALACPVCRLKLTKEGGSYRCENGHSYDISRKGYVNLLMSQKSSKKRHGDDKLMVEARRDFLDKGYYEKLRDAVVSAVKRNADTGTVIVDAGCGEGYYTAAVHSAADGSHVYGIDISKDALIFAARRDRELTLAAASASDIPIINGSADIIISIFAPVFPDEFLRALKDGGILIRAVPLEDHLLELKQAIYDKAYRNPPDDFKLDGFEIISSETVRYMITLDNAKDIESLFMMTPYYYKTSRTDQEKLTKLSHLETRAEFGVIIYRKS